MHRTTLLICVFVFCVIPPTSADIVATVSGVWSSGTTWGGRVPSATDDVTIPSGVTVTLDEDAQVRSLVVRGVLRTRPTRQSEYRHAWTKLAETAEEGAQNLVVGEATGWRAGDRLVVTPTGRNPKEFDDVRVSGIWSHEQHVHVALDRPLTYRHEVIAAPEVDRGHHSGRVQFAGEVLNLTRRLNLLVENEVRVEGGSLYLDDLYVNATIQINDSVRGGVLRRVVGERGAAGQFQTENTQNLLWEECIAYDYTTQPGRGGAGFGWSEKSGKNKELADGVWCVRCVAAAKRSPGGSLSNGRTKGFFFNGLGGGAGSRGSRARAGLVGSVAVGCPGGTEGAAIRFNENGVNGLQFFWMNEAHSSARGLYIDGNNMEITPDGLPFVGGLYWRNTVDGMLWGAYTNRFEMHHFHFLGNGEANIRVITSDALWGRFVLDGEGVTARGVHFIGYVVPPFRFAQYVRTRFRGHTDVSISFELKKEPRINRFVDFPAADFSGENVPRTDFCRYSAAAIPQDVQKHRSPLVADDIVRFDDRIYRHGNCPSGEALPAEPWRLPFVDQQTGEGGERKSITAPGSRYRYEAFVARIEEQPEGGINPVSGEPLVRPLEDWTMVTEIEQTPPELVADRRPRRRSVGK